MLVPQTSATGLVCAEGEASRGIPCAGRSDLGHPGSNEAQQRIETVGVAVESFAPVCEKTLLCSLDIKVAGV